MKIGDKVYSVSLRQDNSNVKYYATVYCGRVVDGDTVAAKRAYPVPGFADDSRDRWDCHSISKDTSKKWKSTLPEAIGVALQSQLEYLALLEKELRKAADEAQSAE